MPGNQFRMNTLGQLVKAKDSTTAEDGKSKKVEKKGAPAAKKQEKRMKQAKINNFQLGRGQMVRDHVGRGNLGRGQLTRGHPTRVLGRPHYVRKEKMENSMKRKIEEKREEAVKRRKNAEERRYDIMEKAANWEKAIATRRIDEKVEEDERDERLGEKKRLMNNINNEEKPEGVERRKLLNILMFNEFHSLDDKEMWAVTDMTATLTVYETVQVACESAMIPAKESVSYDTEKDVKAHEIRPTTLQDFEVVLDKYPHEPMTAAFAPGFKTRERRYNCKICDCSCKYLSYLNKHMKRSHNID